MAVPHSLGNTTRAHEVALFNWLGSLHVDYGDLGGRLQAPKNDYPVLRVFASPERAASAIGDQLIRAGIITIPGSPTPEDYAAEVAKNFKLLPLPFLSVQETGLPSPDLEFASTPKTMQAYIDPATGQWVEHRWPASFYSSYSVTFWSRKRYSQVFFREWVMSQLGPLGAGPSELFIAVQHPEPFTQQMQTLRFDSITDLSDLEGEEPRIQRTELALQLRVLHFYPPTGQNSYYLDTANWGRFYADARDGTDFAPDSAANIEYTATESLNLFVYRMQPAQIPTKWLRLGAATVSQAVLAPSEKARKTSLTVGLSATSDEVYLVGANFTLGVTGKSQGGFSFEYRSDAPVDVVVSQRDGATAPIVWTEVQSVTLPAAPDWTRVHKFFELSQNVISLTLRGTGVDAVAHLTRVDVRHYGEQAEIVPTSTTVGVGETTYGWTGLSNTPYLITVRLVPAAPTTAHTVTATSPSATRTAQVRENQTSQLLLLHPDSDALNVSVPDSLVVAEVVAVAYLGPFRGDEV